jgi:MOSC domain-containing protein YiiM
MQLLSVNAGDSSVKHETPTGETFSCRETHPAKSFRLTGGRSGDSRSYLVVDHTTTRSDRLMCFAAHDLMPYEERWFGPQADYTLPPGIMGETFTLGGTSCMEVRIGARLRIGTVVLEVEQPAGPLWPFSSLKSLDSFMKTAGLAPWQCRVITDGTMPATGFVHYDDNRSGPTVHQAFMEEYLRG